MSGFNERPFERSHLIFVTRVPRTSNIEPVSLLDLWERNPIEAIATPMLSLLNLPESNDASPRRLTSTRVVSLLGHKPQIPLDE